MVQMNPFPGQEYTGRCREGMGECWGGSGMNWEIGTDIYSPPCVKQIVGSCYIAQGAQLRGLWGPRWVGWGARGGKEVREGGSMCLFS